MYTGEEGRKKEKKNKKERDFLAVFLLHFFFHHAGATILEIRFSAGAHGCLLLVKH